MSSFYGGGAGSSSSGASSTVISVTESASNDYAKVYNILQDETIVGTINIPKDMVVSSGVLETDPVGMDAGTYLVLTLANADSDTIYINVADLIDVYTVASSATQIQLAISSGNVISATIVSGAVGTAELADSAITAAKIANGTITLTKLATSVQESLENANSAVQSVTTGTTNGTINVDGVDVSIYGLGSAAYTDSDDYDSAGAATAVLGTSADNAGTATVYGAFASISKNADNISSLSSQVTTNIDSINDLKTTVNTNTDNISSLNTQVNTNVENISNLTASVNTNTESISDLTTVVDNKADKATTLEEYGIADAYTKTETNTEIATAVSNANHLNREIVTELPDISEANELTIYLILKDSSETNNIYDEYMIISGTWEKIGDTAVDLTGYATESYVDDKIDTALETAASDASSKAETALSDAKEYANSLADVANASTIYLNVTTTGTDSNGNVQEELTIATINSALTVTVDEEQESLNMYTAS